VNRHAAASADLVVAVDREGRVIHANPAARRFSEGAVGLADLVAAIQTQMPRSITERWRGEVALRDSRSNPVVLDCEVIVQTGSVHWSAWCRDITETSRVQAALAHQATHDALTSLPNRTLFSRRVAEAIERSRRDGRDLAVMYVDIDRLKDVNDTLGHDFGDVLITTIARRLAVNTRPGDVVGRVGGDEFVVLCERTDDDDTALEVARRMCSALSAPVVLRGIEVASGASVGVATSRGLSRTTSSLDAAQHLMRDADTAMYHAKARGGGASALFDDAMRSEASRRARLAVDLERAVGERRLHLEFQPIVRAHDSRLVACEALLRWEHPTEGLLAPASFIDLAEQSGLIVPIGDWVLDEAARTLALWMDEGRVNRKFRVHVNVSARQVADPHFVEKVTTISGLHGLTPANVALEFDETLLGRDDTLRTLQSLHRIGVQLTIDHFGRGGSSLTTLRNGPADHVKLDASLTGTVGFGDDSLFRSVVQLVHALAASVVAEHVTSPSQHERLRTLGCDYLQGHHIGRPMRAEHFWVGVRSVGD